MVANLRSARVERCQAKNGCDEPVETVRSLFLCLKRQNKKQTQRKMTWRSENV